MAKKESRSVKIFINGKEVENNIKSIRGEMIKLINSQAKMTIGSKEYVEAGKSINQIKSVLKKHRDDLNGVSTVWGKMKTGVKNFFSSSLGGFTTISGIIYGFKKLLTGTLEAIQKQEIINKKANVVLGESYDEVKDKANELANSIYMTRQEFIQATTNTADLLVPLGFARDRSAKLATQLTELSGALAEWNDKGYDSVEVSEILTKAMLGEAEQIKQLGIVIDQSSADYNKRIKVMMETNGMTKEQARALDILNQIQEKSLDAQTSFTTGGNGLLRLQRKINVAWKERRDIIVSNVSSMVDKFLPAEHSYLDTMLGVRGAMNKEIDLLKTANLSNDARKKLIEKINTQYGKYLPQLISEKDTIKEIQEKQDDANKALTKKIILNALEDELTKVLRKQFAIRSVLIDQEIKQAELQEKMRTESNNYSYEAQKIQKEQIEAITALNNIALDASEKETEQIKDNYKKIAEEVGLNFEQLLAIITESMNSTDDEVTNGTKKMVDVQKYLINESIADYGIFTDEIKNAMIEASTLAEGTLFDFGEKQELIHKMILQGMTDSQKEFTDQQIEYMSNGLNMASQIFDKEEERYKLLKERELNVLEKQYEQGLISEEDYKRQIGIIQSKYAEKEKRISKAQAVISGALAVLRILEAKATGNAIADAIIKGALIATTVATTATQIKNIDQTEIPAYAEGTNYHPGGYAVVGEVGPEIVKLPRGSQVYPNKAFDFNAMTGNIPQYANGVYDKSEFGALKAAIDKLNYNLEHPRPSIAVIDKNGQIKLKESIEDLTAIENAAKV